MQRCKVKQDVKASNISSLLILLLSKSIARIGANSLFQPNSNSMVQGPQKSMATPEQFVIISTPLPPSPCQQVEDLNTLLLIHKTNRRTLASTPEDVVEFVRTNTSHVMHPKSFHVDKECERLSQFQCNFHGK